LHGLAPDAPQAPELAIDFLAVLLRKLEPREPLGEVVEFGAVLLLAELAPDRPHLLAQVDLALPLAELLLNLGLDVLLRVEHGDLTLDMHQHATDALVHLEGLEQLLALRGVEVEIASDEVREPTGLIDAIEHLLHDFLRQAGLLAQLGGARAQFLVERDEVG